MIRLQLGDEDFAKYPFLPEAGTYVRRLDISIDALARPDFTTILTRAKRRVLDAAKGRPPADDVEKSDILTFPIVLLLAKATRLEHLMAKVAHAEALRAEKLLAREKPALLEYIFREALGVAITPIAIEFGGRHYDFKLPVPEYLRRAPRLAAPKWKLVNQVVDHGHVLLSRYDLTRLIREEVGRLIYAKFKELPVPKLPPAVAQAVEEIVQAAPPAPTRYAAPAVTPENYPPCVTHALDLLQKGQNVPHYSRFLLSTYLLAIGKSVDSIVDLYPRAPDFNERITRYQVEHIAGLRGGRIKYHVPSCQTLITHSLCFKHPVLCNNIKSPLQYPSKYAQPKATKAAKKWTRKPQPS